MRAGVLHAVQCLPRWPDNPADGDTHNEFGFRVRTDSSKVPTLASNMTLEEPSGPVPWTP